MYRAEGLVCWSLCVYGPESGHAGTKAWLLERARLDERPGRRSHSTACTAEHDEPVRKWCTG